MKEVLTGILGIILVICFWFGLVGLAAAGIIRCTGPKTQTVDIVPGDCVRKLGDSTLLKVTARTKETIETKHISETVPTGEPGTLEATTMADVERFFVKVQCP